uniref:Uncharacterized protein n=1 Tax=Nelumbo nucifera TaxID=4432 RepID=A0A822Z4V5_NELNU|nr:TPA_asm: hypothetical protein HUJ06_014426 [Nelumbo nucifera]
MDERLNLMTRRETSKKNMKEIQRYPRNIKHIHENMATRNSIRSRCITNQKG